jgi:hypothetical protein
MDGRGKLKLLKKDLFKKNLEEKQNTLKSYEKTPPKVKKFIY